MKKPLWKRVQVTRESENKSYQKLPDFTKAYCTYFKYKINTEKVATIDHVKD